MKFLCDECDWTGPKDKVLTALHPFLEGEEIWGCPKCREANCLKRACDADGCWEYAHNGTPTQDGGYMVTCYAHIPKEKADEPTGA